MLQLLELELESKLSQTQSLTSGEQVTGHTWWLLCLLLELSFFFFLNNIGSKEKKKKKKNFQGRLAIFFHVLKSCILHVTYFV